MLKSLLIILLSLVSISLISQDRICTFEELSGDDIFHYYYEYSSTDNGFIIKSVKTYNKDTLETQILTTDKNYNSRKWVYIRESDGTYVTAGLKGEKVIFKGKHDDEYISEEFDLDGYQWIQIFPMNPGLNEWIKSDEEEIRFWIIGNAGPADMEINKFVAEKEGIEKQNILNNNTDCWNIEITLSGWKSVFWSGNYFYSKDNMHVVKYDGGGAPGNPGSITTIIHEMINKQ